MDTVGLGGSQMCRWKTDEAFSDDIDTYILLLHCVWIIKKFSMIKSALVSKNFQTWLLIGGQYSYQPIRNYARKSLLTTIDFDFDVSQ